MTGPIKGVVHEPNATARARRTAQRLRGSDVFRLKGSGGLEQGSDGIGILLDPTNPGLALTTTGLKALVQGVLSIDASGILATLGDGIENVGNAITVDLDADPVLLRSAGGIRVDTDEMYRLHWMWG